MASNYRKSKDGPWEGARIPNCGDNRYEGVVKLGTLYLDEYSQGNLVRNNLRAVREQNR